MKAIPWKTSLPGGAPPGPRIWQVSRASGLSKQAALMNSERRLIATHRWTGDTLPYLGAPPPVGYRLWQSHTRFVGFSLNPLNKQDWHNAPLCFPSFNRPHPSPHLQWINMETRKARTCTCTRQTRTCGARSAARGGTAAHEAQGVCVERTCRGTADRAEGARGP